MKENKIHIRKMNENADYKKNLSEEDKDMIVNEISLVIQKIFSVKQPKDQRFKVTEINQENDGVTNEMIWSLMKVQTKKSVITIK